MQAAAAPDHQLQRLRPGQEEAEVQRALELIRVDPPATFNQFTTQQRYLCGRPAERGEAQPRPQAKCGAETQNISLVSGGVTGELLRLAMWSPVIISW
jgi:hypothetical protein